MNGTYLSIVTLCYTVFGMEYSAFEFGEPTNKKKPEAVPTLSEVLKEKREKEKKDQEEARQKAVAKKQEESQKDTAEPDEKKSLFEFKKTADDQEITDEEQKHQLAKEYIAEKSEELKTELTELDASSPAAVEILADLELLSALNEKLDDPELSVDPAVELAYQQIMQQLESLTDPEDAEDQSEHEHTETDSPEASKTPTTPATPLNIPALLRPKKNSGVSAAPATRPPLNLSGSTSETRDISTPSGVDMSNSTTPTRGSHSPAPEQARSTPSTTEAMPRPEKPDPNQKRAAASLLVASSVGSMLESPRTADIAKTSLHTEKVATHTKEALANPVRSIAEKEQAIRTVALRQIVESPRPKIREVPRPPLQTAEQTAPVRTTDILTQPTEHMLHTSLQPLEKPLHIETRPTPPTSLEQTQPRTEQKLQKETARKVEQSSTQELLKVAHDIHIDGTTVRQLYESNKIDHRGLVAIVKEALAGGNVKKAYKHATLGHEAQRGRKIEMRHDDPALINDTVLASQSKESVERTEQLLDQLHQVQSPQPAPPATTISSEEKTISDLSYQQVQKAMRKKRIASLTLATTLALSGAAAIAWLILS